MCQYGFIPGDSCVAQLLSIMHEIYESFDCNPSNFTPNHTPGNHFENFQ